MVSVFDVHKMIADVTNKVRMEVLAPDDLLRLTKAYIPDYYRIISKLLYKGDIGKACDTVESRIFEKDMASRRVLKDTRSFGNTRVGVNLRNRKANPRSRTVSSNAKISLLNQLLEKSSSANANKTNIVEEGKKEKRSRKTIARSGDAISDDKIDVTSLDDDELFEIVEKRNASSKYFANRIEGLSQKFRQTAESAAPLLALTDKAPSPREEHPDDGHDMAGLSTMEGITSAQMQAYRTVAAAISRAQRARLTPEQAEHQSKQGAKRAAAFRDRLTPEQRAARNATEAERLRRKRALAKTPQP